MHVPAGVTMTTGRVGSTLRRPSISSGTIVGETLALSPCRDVYIDVDCILSLIDASISRLPQRRPSFSGEGSMGC